MAVDYVLEELMGKLGKSLNLISIISSQRINKNRMSQKL